MNRTTLLLTTSIVLQVACQSKQPAKQPKPNILFILADDFGYHDMSITGSTYYETPHIDRIATEGMIFTHGYANSQVCSPSRASIMSGKSAVRQGITDWIGARKGEEWRKQNRFTKLLPSDYVHNLPHEYTTLPEALKEAGYKTFFAGKWHLGSEGSYPEDHGFDINQGGFEQGGSYTKFGKEILERSHEVLIWPQGTGVGAFASLHYQKHLNMPLTELILCQTNLM